VYGSVGLVVTIGTMIFPPESDVAPMEIVPPVPVVGVAADASRRTERAATATMVASPASRSADDGRAGCMDGYLLLN